MRIALLTFVFLAGIGILAGNLEQETSEQNVAQRAGARTIDV